jgi:hypothetical protein
MYCDGCGRPFNSGTRYCSSCGKQLMTGPAAPTMPTAVNARVAGDGRLRRNINMVAGFWLANGILRLIEVVRDVFVMRFVAEVFLGGDDGHKHVFAESGFAERFKFDAI